MEPKTSWSVQNMLENGTMTELKGKEHSSIQTVTYLKALSSKTKLMAKVPTLTAMDRNIWGSGLMTCSMGREVKFLLMAALTLVNLKRE